MDHKQVGVYKVAATNLFKWTVFGWSKPAGYFELCLVNVVHSELAVRLA